MQAIPRIDRRQLLATGGAWLATRAVGLPLAGWSTEGELDALLEAHAGVLPERAGAGANHYPMAAEALEALGHAGAIEESWREGAAGYAGDAPRVAIVDAQALGSYERFGDWLAHFRAELRAEDWRPALARWAQRLAPGLCGGAFHGLIRTGHAVRALARRDSPARRNELALALAYWAARYAELPAEAPRKDASLRQVLAELEHPWLEDSGDVDFFGVTGRMARAPNALPPELTPDADVKAELDELVHEAAMAFLELLVQERHAIWLLHTVTAPAAAGLLLPEVDRAGAAALVEHARQGVIAMLAVFGAPYTPRAHLPAAAPPWSELIERAVESRSVHTIKLVEALVRFDRGDDPLYRAVAVRWLG